MKRKILTVVSAASAAIIIYSCVRGLEALFVSMFAPPFGEMRTVNYVVLSIAFGVAMYLWLDLRTTRAALTSMERSRVVTEMQLALAAEVQRRLLPPVPSTVDHVRWASETKPAYQIGGDFYDFIPTAHDDTLVLVGDVSGKGIPAALLQASAHSLLRTYSRQTPHPEELLRLVSREIYAENGGTQYLTCLAIRVDAADGTLTYTNAGHPPGLLLGPPGRRLLNKGGPPVGMFAETRYESETVRVEAGDVGIIVTDGITEAIEQEGVTTVDRLSAIVSSVSRPRTPKQICDALMAVADRSGGPGGVSNWQDDRTVLAFMVERERESMNPAGNRFLLAEPQPQV
jgi:serine phosphatase RsbU (regulator of sigma subunit)